MIPRLVAALAVVWLAALVVAPLLPAAAAALLYAFGGLVCHQRPERSFHLDAFQLPVCARCLGLYAGAALGACAAVVWAGRGTAGAGHVPRATPGPREGGPFVANHIPSITILALVPTMVTVALEWLGLWAPSNAARAAAGLPAGAVVAFVVTHALATVHYGECARRPPTVPNPDRPST